MLIVFIVLVAVVALMLVGVQRSKGLPGWLRVVTTLVPALALVGTAVTYVLLVFCNLSDSPSAACATTTAIALPLMLGYIGVTGGTWLGSVLGGANQRTRGLLVRVSAATAVGVPIIVFVGLLTYYNHP